MFQIFFVPKYFWVLEALIFGTLLPDHPVQSLSIDNPTLTIQVDKQFCKKIRNDA